MRSHSLKSLCLSDALSKIGHSAYSSGELIYKALVSKAKSTSASILSFVKGPFGMILHLHQLYGPCLNSPVKSNSKTGSGNHWLSSLLTWQRLSESFMAKIPSIFCMSPPSWIILKSGTASTCCSLTISFPSSEMKR